MGDYENFNKTMDAILRADPAKEDAEIQASKAEHEAKGERKRGRKAKRAGAGGAKDK